MGQVRVKATRAHRQRAAMRRRLASRSLDPEVRRAGRTGASGVKVRFLAGTRGMEGKERS